MKDKLLRNKIADYLEKAIRNKTESVFVPAASEEWQEHLAYDKILEMADVIIPMVKGSIGQNKSIRVEARVINFLPDLIEKYKKLWQEAKNNSIRKTEGGYEKVNLIEKGKQEAYTQILDELVMQKYL